VSNFTVKSRKYSVDNNNNTYRNNSTNKKNMNNINNIDNINNKILIPDL
jgi:hypothetical protein